MTITVPVRNEARDVVAALNLEADSSLISLSNGVSSQASYIQKVM
jgi:hypothetical protein